MLARVRTGVQSRKPMSHVLKQVRKIDPTISYGKVTLKYRQLMAANLTPNWSQSTSAVRGKRHHRKARS